MSDNNEQQLNTGAPVNSASVNSGSDNPVVQQPSDPVVKNYLDAIKELKDSSVPKDKYEKLVDENKQLLKTITEQTPATNMTAAPIKTDEDRKKEIDALRHDLYNKEDTDFDNLDYIKKTLQLRQDLIDSGEPDPFVGRGEKLVPDDNDYECAAKVADVLQQCVDYAQGDSALFTQELQRRTLDVPLPRRKTSTSRR